MTGLSNKSILVALSIVAAAWSIPFTTARAADVPVTNCNDAGAGSLRNAAAIALDNDVIDMRGLTCTRILLTSGPVIFNQFTITLQGPGLSRLAIDAQARSAVLRHHITGTGGSSRLIRIRDLTVRWGRINEPGIGYGACVYSGGSVELVRVSIHHCVGNAVREMFGAGVAARRNLRIIESLVYDNRGTSQLWALGGGAYGGMTLLLDRSRLLRNTADFAGGSWGGVTTVRASSVSNNKGGGMQSPFTGGDVQGSTFTGNDTFGLYIASGHVANSTFSGNTGPGVIGEGGTFWQNTIAYNTIPRDPDTGLCRGGMDLQNGQVQLRGNLMAHNSCDGMPLDYSAREVSFFLPTSRNLIMYASAPTPADTRTADPRIGPLASNGGPTQTHALLQGSPAINVGSSADVGPWDQRGEGFPRRSCGGTVADIGAYEYQCAPR